MKLMPVDDARAAMLAEVSPLAGETVALKNAIGRVLAQDVAAIRNQPPFDASAMDGWALRSADAPGTLAIAGESAAGHGYEGVLQPGQAVRIFTGAAMPAGADTIVIQEDATREGDAVTVPASAPGANLRPAGGDFRAGQALLTAGTRIDPWRLSLAASAGRAEVLVHARPRVAIVSTGEEIVEAPAAPGPYQIYDSGAPALTAMVEGWGGLAFKCKPIRDELDAVIAALRDADADLVVTVGGASVGDHDLVRAAAEALGLSLKVASVNVRPGKPTFFGVFGDGRRLLGLPGNPASAFVCAELFLKPIVMKMQGGAENPPMVSARLAAPLAANGPREHWMRAKLSHVDGGLTAEPYRDQDSSLVTVFAAADALLRRPAGAPALAAGELAEVLPLTRG
ncbi:molybdenum cofactor biosynthesis protein MoeA [Phenylobacterium sp. Root77]|uniref:molybdopterin molybdotransferase MoeA n=1 Tax=unclassified Phenylobacterium TaxID=2640670 RepID=UPI0006FA4653|nr:MULTISPECIES: gephyrin-like molybdotransferase Glp [unclassified Phenylobacterium]KQW69449.1 molybdenum cofactor biosynthesis protein MoeA [Phenylobacterium sp. Root1277]KQW95185.1 molybdenum cofactor biosynthesis protein MoeA [Phenylobacterium sp. Root1290]KRC40976.1 molybdenum cofactor biosynthesis protein MoeA [Phenylobacterium sp. Root77]